MSGTVDIVATGAALGADVAGIDLSMALDGASVAALSNAWREHLVLRFRGQSLSDDDLLRFSRCFGPLDKAPINPYGTTWVPEHPEINVISNIMNGDQRTGGLGDGEASWHADMTYTETPPRGCLLYALEIPVAGGDTGFASMFAAYDGLPEETKARIETLRCKHDCTRNSVGQLRKGFAESYASVEDVPGAVHPLVRVHPETGRRALFLGRRRNAYVMGLSIDDSEALLDELWAHIADPAFNWHQQWQVGDLIIWDNRFTLHRRDAFDPAARRHMRRTQIGDTEPVLGISG